jgi:MFS family permease
MSPQLSELSSRAEQANFRHLVMDIAWFGLALAATSRFLSVYAIHLGATAAQLGWINALPALMLLLSAAFGGWWRKRYPNSVKALFLPGLGMRLMFLLPAFAPFLPTSLQPWWIILAVSIPAIPQGIAGVTFLGMMRESIVDHHLTQLLSKRSLALNLALAVGAVSFGLWLEKAPFPLDYQIMFLLAFVFALWSLRHCMGVRIITPIKAPAQSPRVNPWRSPAFRRVALVAGVIHVAFTSILAITPLHLVNNLGATEGFMALFGLIELGAGASVAVLTPRLVHRFGNRGMIALAMVGTAVAAIIFALSPNLYVTLVGAALSGASWTAAAMVGLFAYFNESTPADQMMPYSTAYHQIIGLSAFIGPMIGSTLASGGMNLATVLMIGAALRFFAGPLTEHHLFWRRGHQPDSEHAAAKP